MIRPSSSATFPQGKSVMTLLAIWYVKDVEGDKGCEVLKEMDFSSSALLLFIDLY